MAFRRGFKSQCERRSVEIRKDLGLEETAPLSAFYLAQHMDVTVWSTSQITALTDQDLTVLNDPADDSWSAFTMRMGHQHLVVFKDGVSKPRVNSVIMHELSHVTLGHELAEACVLEDGSLVPSNFSQDQEDEADWLAGTLLLPRPALLAIRRRKIDDGAAQSEYQVSGDMLRWRTRMTGIDYQWGNKLRQG